MKISKLALQLKTMPMKNLTKTILGGLAMSFGALATLSPSAALATPIPVTVTISDVEGDDLDPGLFQGRSDWYSKVTTDGVHLGSSSTIDNHNNIMPNWTFSRSVEPRGRSSYNVPVTIELWDNDGFLNPDDHARITSQGGDLNLTYNLRTRTFMPSSPTRGSDATVFFSVTSNPFAFDAGLTGIAQQLGGVYNYLFTLTNPATSTFAIDALDPTLPEIVRTGLLQTPMLPGDPARMVSFFDPRGPRFNFADVSYDDLGNTGEVFQVQLPGVPDAGSTAGLLGLSVAIVVLARRRFAIIK